MSKLTGEAFVVYHEGVSLQLQWTTVPPLVRSPALRFCCLNEHLLLLLTADECLYTAHLSANRSMLHMELQRNDVIDVDYSSITQQLFIVTNIGHVLMQQLSVDSNYRSYAWKTLSFDPLELTEDGVSIQRVCCSAQGVLFLTRNGQVYVMGSCGDVFATESQPLKLSQFDDSKEFLDVNAGAEFFVLLLKRIYDEKEDPLNLSLRKIQNTATTTPRPAPPAAAKPLTRQSTMEIELSLDVDDLAKRQELNSNSSVRSFSSKSSQSQVEATFEMNIQNILLLGYNLLHTQVYTFGAVNNGLLGTGDHIKRANMNNIQKLDSIGICSIAAGKEHTVARTLDGRLYHWGLNSKQQLNGCKELTDLSAATELKLDSIELDSYQRNILAACCGDYRTVLLNARGELQSLPLTKRISYQNEFINLQFGESSISNAKQSHLRLLLVAGEFTLHNQRTLQRQYHSTYVNLQTQLKLMLKYRHAIKMLQRYQEKSLNSQLKLLQQVCLNFEKILCLLAASVHSMETFYCSDSDNAVELLFINYYRECLELFEEYTKSYCDIFSIDGFAEAAKIFAHYSNEPLMPQQSDEIDLARIFQQPLQIFPIFVSFLEQLLKTRVEFKEHHIAWETFARQNCIRLELAENTQEFWRNNARNARIRHFRRKHRRVILTSAVVPLKLTNNTISISTPTFILFSDCLCQATGSQVFTYPLCTMWLKIETNDNLLRVITPEKILTLATSSHLDKMMWHDQLESSIVAALGRPVGSKVPNIRVTAYVFSPKHSKFANVHSYGRWKQGALHGNCYLEYPDGKFYCGEVRNNEIDGHGKMVIPSIGIYEGSFRAGKFHGHGVYEMKDNEVYEGNFRDGMFHGYGMLRSNNYVHIGEYQANSRNGYGILDDMLSGDKYMGMFADNKRTGAGTCITMKGDYFEGLFANDELTGTGIAVFENDYYYEGELNMSGPSGKGTYYMPSGGVVETEEWTANAMIDDCHNYQLLGNVLSGHLGGTWQDVRVINGTVAIQRSFPKYPKSIGELVVDNNRKWRALFDNFEEQILGPMINIKPNSSINYTKQLWQRIAIFMSTERKREKMQEQQDNSGIGFQSTRSYFAKNISIGYSNSFDKLSLKSTSSLLNAAKSSILDLNGSFVSPRRTYSHENVSVLERRNSTADEDFLNSTQSSHNDEHNSTLFNNVMMTHFDKWAQDSNSSTRSSFDSVSNLSGSINNNNNSSFSAQSAHDYVPNFGLTSTLSEQDVVAIKEYLEQAFKDRHHPLYLLDQRIANCFYHSYGCWKVKPTPILAKQAMLEWESISKRVYKFVRKMFPALPEDYCFIENTREVVSHITLLYPILLSEGIYSTLFVLYANKCSGKDELYRQNLIYADKLTDEKLADILGLNFNALLTVGNDHFLSAINTLKQLQEKYSPKAMLSVIELCMQHINDAHQTINDDVATSMLAADSVMPLTLFLILRAAVPHLGAELALLDDLTGSANFQFIMNGFAGYCYTTLKAAYEHIAAKQMNKS